MIGNALRVDIERFAAGRIRKSPLFKMAEDGLITRACLREYLENIHYLVSCTPPCLERAAERAREQGQVALEAHFRNKLKEETGHDVWAERDIASVADSSTRLQTRPTAGMEAMVAHVRATIEREPLLYLAYILFAEHFTVVIGPEWIRLLEERCGIPSSSLSVVTNHVELDVEHVEHALDEIDDLVGDPAKLSALREVLMTSMDCFEQFCGDLASTHRGAHERVARASSDVRVSAA